MKILRRILVAVILVVVLLVAGGSVIVVRWTRGPLPQVEGTVTLAGLDDRVEIIRDVYGIPHIYASSASDLRFAQGYVQAQDRWWQMEFGRHIGHGRLQELTGENAALLGTDMFLRTLGLTQAAERDWDALPAVTRAEMEAFADGVNAYLHSRPPSQLAFEYNVLGLTGVAFEVDDWTPIDSLVWTKVVAWDLADNMAFERARLDMLTVMDAAMVAAFFPAFPYGQKPTVLRADELPDLETTGSAAHAPSAWSLQPGIAPFSTRLVGNYDDSDGLLLGRASAGSNAWVVSGDLTASGQPLFSNDPHLSIQMPSIWYEIGLYCRQISTDCPYQTRGYGFASTPYIAVGRSDRIAFGITSLEWDVQDLYQITVNPDNPLQYRYNDEWRDMIVREEVIRAGDSDVTVTLQVRETHFGPIINDNQLDPDTGEILGFNNDNPLALRWTGAVANQNMYALTLLNQAQNWDEFREALRYWESAGENYLYADVDGNIGYQATGLIPVRAAGHTGALPVDGSSDAFEWRGFLPYDDLPHTLNPARGFIASANNAIVPQAYYEMLQAELADEFGTDANHAFAYDWAQGYRAQRAEALIVERAPHTVETFQAMQGDNKLIVFEELSPYLAALDMGDDDLNAARDWLLDWDYQLDSDSARAALYVNVWHQLVRAIYADEIGDLVALDGYDTTMWATVLLAERPDHPWWDNVETESVVETRDDIVIAAFRAGYEATAALLGDDRDTWQWGALHTATFVSNPLGASGIDMIENLVNVGPVPVSGGSATLNATRWAGIDDFTVSTIPSVRMVIDFGDLSASRSIHSTGQSGHPFSEHYSDMVEDWRRLTDRPMLFDRAAVEANQAALLVLQPE